MWQGEMCASEPDGYGKSVDKEVAQARVAAGHKELRNLDHTHEPDEQQGGQ